MSPVLTWLAYKRDLWGGSGTLQQLLYRFLEPWELGFRLCLPQQGSILREQASPLSCVGSLFPNYWFSWLQGIFLPPLSHTLLKLQGNKTMSEKVKKSSQSWFSKYHLEEKIQFLDRILVPNWTTTNIFFSPKTFNNGYHGEIEEAQPLFKSQKWAVDQVRSWWNTNQYCLFGHKPPGGSILILDSGC